MDDLLAEDWQSSSKRPAPSTTSPPNPSAFASNYTAFRASPVPSNSGTASPQNISRPSSTLNGASKPVDDKFGNLLSLKSAKGTGNISIQERQKQLIEERRRQQDKQAQLWDSLGSGRQTPVHRSASPAVSQTAVQEDDILAAFNKSAPVNRASHFPPPSSGAVSGTATPNRDNSYSRVDPIANSSDQAEDDPFDLASVSKQSNGHVATAQPIPDDGGDDDLLGDLGKPIDKLPRRSSPTQPRQQDRAEAIPEMNNRHPNQSSDDRAIAQMVDLGFPADTAKIALAENGGNVQRAVAWLFDQAGEESRQTSRHDEHKQNRKPSQRGADSLAMPSAEQGPTPQWMRQSDRSGSGSRRHDNRSPGSSEKEASQVAQEFGSKLFKSANSLWKAGQKQVAKTMADFQQERDSTQPKWMQESTTGSSGSDAQSNREETPKSRPARRSDAQVTNEAALLDMPRERPQKPPRQSKQAQAVDVGAPEQFSTQAQPRREPSKPAFSQQTQAPVDRRPTAKLSRQEVEDQTAQAYISPARRKRPIPNPEPPTQDTAVDLFSSAPIVSKPSPSSNNSNASAAPSRKRSPPVPPAPKSPPRSIPEVSASVLAKSASHRKAGGEAFKRGDYALAHEAYSAALAPLPPTHPIAIVVLSNRSLTALKTGDAKAAVADADQALAVIGAGQGVGETIDLGSTEGGPKDMREFYGKALMRKAEALEHLEKWTDAAAAWRVAVAAGVGGAISLRGRDRCEKAAAPAPTSRPPAAATAPKPASQAARSHTPGYGKAPPPKSLGDSTQRPTLSSPGSAEAVKKLRAANAAADRTDDEKFALADQVDARLAAWKGGGKTDNLRALLQSLDTVLWADAGWKKVGMSDLVMPNKVKIVYMKAIAKVHPDKIAQDATTEQRMISAAVFSTLNEAWDKFKKDNNL